MTEKTKTYFHNQKELIKTKNQNQIVEEIKVTYFGKHNMDGDEFLFVQGNSYGNMNVTIPGIIKHYQNNEIDGIKTSEIEPIKPINQEKIARIARKKGLEGKITFW